MKRTGPAFSGYERALQARSLIKKGLDIAKDNNITCHKGVYVAVTGPNLETRAEYRYLRIIGGDAVGHEYRARSDCGKPYGIAGVCHISING
jgi:purine nucleoside phosphorylase